MIRQQRKITALLLNMEAFVTQRIELTGTVIFGQNEIALTKVAMVFFRIGCISLSVFVATPAIIIAVAYAKDTLTEDMLQSPFKDLYLLFRNCFDPFFYFHKYL